MENIQNTGQTTDDNTPEDTEEDVQREEEALKEVKEDDIRNEVIEKYGLDEDEQSETIDKLTNDLIEQRKSFGKAISQKRKWRERAETKVEKPKDSSPESKSNESVDVEKLVEQKFEQRYLDDLELSDNLRTSVQELARLRGVSAREVVNDPIIVKMKEEEEQQQRVTSATPKRSNKGSYVANVDPTQPLNPEDFDFNTEEGVKAWNEAKEARRQHESR